MVEGSHFNRDVENLKGYYNLERGFRAPPGADINFTLRVFPNHTRALYALARLEEKEGGRPKGVWWSVPCYFSRAIAFAPDDAGVRVVYGIYLLRRGASDQALKQLEAAHETIGSDPNLNYNLGLAYFDARQYDRALEYAKKAYALGFPLDGLKNKLKKAGKWQD
jgi:Tfp pilus assembly protein PilF